MLELRAQLGLGAAKPEPDAKATLAGAVSVVADQIKGRVTSEKVMDVPENWIVMNAPRPLLGTRTLEGGPFLSGRFYAAIDPAEPMAARYVKENRKLDACVVVFATKAQQIEMALIGNEYADRYRAEYQGDELYEVLNQLDKLRDKTAGELKALLAQVSAVPVAAVSLSGHELGDFPDTEDGKIALRAAAKASLLALRGKMVACPILGESIEIRKRGIKETMRFSANPDKLKMIAAIESIIGTATSKSWEENYKKDAKPEVDGYFTLKNSVSIDGRVLNVDVLIEKDIHGLLHYDLMIDRQTKTALDSASGAVSVAERPRLTKPGNSVDSSISNGADEINAAAFDSASGAMILNLFIEGESPADQEVFDDEPHPAIATPQKIAAGGMDGSGEPLEVLQSLYDQISGAVEELNAADLLTGEAEDAANAAITHWAEIEEKLNG